MLTAVDGKETFEGKDKRKFQLFSVVISSCNI